MKSLKILISIVILFSISVLANQRPETIAHRKSDKKADVRDHRQTAKRPVVIDHRRSNNTKKPLPPPRGRGRDKKDMDKDGIADSFEMTLARKFAPALKLPPDHKD